MGAKVKLNKHQWSTLEVLVKESNEASRSLTRARNTLKMWLLMQRDEKGISSEKTSFTIDPEKRTLTFRKPPEAPIGGVPAEPQ